MHQIGAGRACLADHALRPGHRGFTFRRLMPQIKGLSELTSTASLFEALAPAELIGAAVDADADRAIMNPELVQATDDDLILDHLPDRPLIGR